ncbi:LuxR C-terminal-related transcriptional regulator [Gynuella sunshinyii]|uniref:ATP-dependent transcriptional regulator n=1 Tax=Gynuella sunshinyii YC6258 TaxID=1445510 RepID=A0A0C5VCE7_9GAMM|nr:LuxR C-terminal-related transcriptional regulator [Gynuella sunshinyii]AJQ97015.1 ATP-dependent transcriptional regulator [Gynuella sunshinyii YC6258]
MPDTILASKLYRPPLRQGRVFRRDLIERLNAGLHGRLTLVSAPAGFGKSTLINEWMGQWECAGAWLSLEAADAETLRFIRYLVAALTTIDKRCTARTMALLQSSQLPAMETILTGLLNDLTAFGAEFALVLDDYHVIDQEEVDTALGFLIERLPANAHVVICTREDPGIPLARWRVRGEMTELRAPDLRFSTAEAAEFLSHTMQLNLREADIQALKTRTEGWIAGLQMAALSLQGRDDSEAFIQAFTGSHRFVMDYLVEEVLQQQSASLCSFLLQTSILERLSGDLCDAVTGQTNGRQVLRSLEQLNLFVIPLDDERRWYRYHHLFAEVLQTRLQAEYESSALQHLRASVWFEQQDDFEDAIHHALRAFDYERAADLVECCWPTLRLIASEHLFLNWMQQLPDAVIRNRPVLSGYFGLILLSTDLDRADSYLSTAETRILSMDTGQAEAVCTSNQLALAQIPGIVAIGRAYYAGATGDFAGIIEYAHRALESLPEQDSVWRGSAGVLLGLAQWNMGDVIAARQAISDGVASMKVSMDISAIISASYLQAETEMALGRLQQAYETCQSVLQQAFGQRDWEGDWVPQGTADVHVLVSEILLERGELQAAIEQLNRSRELGEPAGLLESRHRWYIVMARIRQIQGQFADAGELLVQAAQLQLAGPAPDVRPVSAWQARLWLAQGMFRRVADWADSVGLQLSDDIPYPREFEYLTLARWYLLQPERWQQGTLVDLQAMLSRMRQAAEAGKRDGSFIEILWLQSLTQRLAGQPQLAAQTSTRAMSLVHQAGYLAITAEFESLATVIMTTAAPAGQLLGESLSERELEVLTLLAGDLSGPQIADRLFVSLNTLRTHTKNIYQKLDVNNRRAAVTLARQLGLIS